jgi:hypothetical protein
MPQERFGLPFAQPIPGNAQDGEAACEGAGLSPDEANSHIASFPCQTGYDSGTLGHRRKLIATRKCDGDVDCVIATLQELKELVEPGKTVYVALGSIS